MSVLSTSAAAYSILSIDLPGVRDLAAGVLLEDSASDRVYLRLRRDWPALVADATLTDDDAEVLEALEDDLNSKALEFGAARFFAWLEASLSNSIRISDREPCLMAPSAGWERTLAGLYQRHVAPRILPFRTHLPVYTLRAAAGRLLENQDITEEGWEEVPADLRLTDDLFIAHIQGRSMEPRIPDGSRCVFRSNVAGSRDGRLVLVENLREGQNNRYTVKRYRSVKVQAEDGSWAHSRIHLEPLNPEFEGWDLDPDDGQVRVIAEFVRVLPW